jgi:hypothetical protein
MERLHTMITAGKEGRHGKESKLLGRGWWKCVWILSLTLQSAADRVLCYRLILYHLHEVVPADGGSRFLWNITKSWRLEFITNLMHNFICSIIILHHDLQHISSIAVLIFRRTIVYLQYLVSSHSVWQHTEWDDTRYCKYTIVPWRWEQRCSKHVEDHDVILLLNI